MNNQGRRLFQIFLPKRVIVQRVVTNQESGIICGNMVIKKVKSASPVSKCK